MGQWNRKESLETDLHIYGDSVSAKAGIEDLWERWAFQTGTVAYSYGKECNWIPTSIHKQILGRLKTKI